MILKVFISYSTADSDFKEVFKKHLVTLQIEGLIEIKDGDMIAIGKDWDHEIRENLKWADILIFLLSPDSIVSDYINNVELKTAVDEGKQIFPILLRPCNWFGLSISRYMCLPKNGRAISSFENKDQIYTEIVASIREEVIQLANSKQRPATLFADIDYSQVGSILSDLKKTLNKTVLLATKIPLVQENTRQGVITFLDTEDHKDEIFDISLDFINNRNDLLSALNTVNSKTFSEIEKCLESLYSYVSMSRVGGDISSDIWRSLFKKEVISHFDILFNLLLKTNKS